MAHQLVEASSTVAAENAADEQLVGALRAELASVSPPIADGSAGGESARSWLRLDQRPSPYC